MTRPYYLLYTVFLVLGACEPEPPTPVVGQRTESDQQVRKLREDNEAEFKDLRGRWLAAEAQLIQLKKGLSKTSGQTKSELDKVSEAIQALETEMLSMRSALGGTTGLNSGAGLSATVSLPERERLRRSAEEIICLRRRGADEQVVEVYERYGFTDEKSWSVAWSRHATNAAFESELFARLKALCPREPEI